MAGPFEIPVGRGVIVADPFGNVLVLVDLSKGKYVTDRTGQVTGIAPAQPGDARDNILARTGTFCCATVPPNTRFCTVGQRCLANSKVAHNERIRA
jgi:hypothetical protein